MSFRSARALLLSALTFGAVVPVAVLSTACNSNSCCSCGRSSCCGQGSHAARSAYAAGGAPSAPAAGGVVVAASAFEAQAARGQALYGRHCASCHGASGQGSQGAPALVGAGALPKMRSGAKLRTGEFRTAGDIARFVVANMPPTGPKPSAEEDLAILAFALEANGVTRTEAVDMGNVDSIVLHP